jgi:hypothetical protein
MSGPRRVSRRTYVALLAALCALVALPSVAGAAVRIKHDKFHEVRFVLDGKTLTTTVVDLPRYMQSPPTLSELAGKRVRIACGTSFRHLRRSTVLVRQVLWPRGARSVTVDFRRDLSHRVRWCVIDSEDTDDVATISFHAAEPARVLARGDFDDGKRWRLVAWRGDHLEPCVGIGSSSGSLSTCFQDEAEEEARLGARAIRPRCDEQGFIVGATGRSARTVTVGFEDGTAIAATLYRRPPDSRVRAQYFVVAVRNPERATSVVARDAKGRLVGRERSVGASGIDCRGGFR